MTAELAWRESALCAQSDPELFVLDVAGSPRAAQAVCRRCPVTGPCLAYALDHNERFGVWGGLSPQQRRRLTKTAGSAA